MIPWERLRASVEEAEALARQEEFDAFEFGGVPAVAPLPRAVTVLREMNRAASPRLPRSVPTAFVRERWPRDVLPGTERRPAPGLVPPSPAR